MTTRSHRRPRPDAGLSFVELLVTVVLIGLTVVATLTALSVSIAGSDQHRSKINAVSELEGAGAYLARVAYNATCSTTVASLNTDLTNRPGTVSTGIDIAVTNVTCTPDGLPQAALVATSDKGDAIESLDVTLGGISVLKSEGSGGPGPGCTWGTLSATPASGVTAHTSGAKDGELKSNATISLRLSFTGTCPSPVTAEITSSPSPPGPALFTKSLVQDPLDPQVLNATLVYNEPGVHWEPGTYTVTVPVVPAPAVFVIG